MFEVVPAWHASNIDRFVMIRGHLLGVSPNDCTQKVTLPRVLLKGVSHWLLQGWHESRSDFIGVPLARCDDVLHFDCRADSSSALISGGADLGADNLKGRRSFGVSLGRGNHRLAQSIVTARGNAFGNDLLDIVTHLVKRTVEVFDSIRGNAHLQGVQLACHRVPLNNVGCWASESLC